MSDKSTNKVEDNVRAEYSRQALGAGVRGKYHARFTKGTNLVLLEDRIAKAFPTSKAVNEALRGLLSLAESSARTANSPADPDHPGR